MPMTVDSIAPTVSDLTVTPKNGKYEVSFNAQDNATDYNSAVVWVNGQNYTLEIGKKSLLSNTEPKSIVILAVDCRKYVLEYAWGDPSYIKSSMVVQTVQIYPNANINNSKPGIISAYAYSRVDWTVNVKDASGNIVDSFEVKK
jgi:lactocepin